MAGHVVGEEVEPVVGGDEHVVDRVVVAARAGEPGGEPRVVDGDLVGRQEECLVLGSPVGARLDRPALGDHAPADDPVSVEDSATERPAAGDPKAVFDPFGATDGHHPSRRELIGLPVQLVDDALVDAHSRVHLAVAADHRDPARRTIVVADRLEHLDRLERRQLETTVT